METSPSIAGDWLESSYLPYIARRVAYRCGVALDDLPDLLQEVRIALWKAGLEQPINSTWVFQTASHKAIDLKRRAVSRGRKPATGVLPEAADSELIHLLRARASGLSGALQIFYTFRYVEGLSEREIAKRMGISRSSVRWMERRCRIQVGVRAKS
jgi:RNA polymerase sigma factor (sigma-70 family)